MANYERRKAAAVVKYLGFPKVQKNTDHAAYCAVLSCVGGEDGYTLELVKNKMAQDGYNLDGINSKITAAKDYLDSFKTPAKLQDEQKLRLTDIEGPDLGSGTINDEEDQLPF